MSWKRRYKKILQYFLTNKSRTPIALPPSLVKYAHTVILVVHRFDHPHTQIHREVL